MLTMICASLSWVLSSAMSSAYPVLLTLTMPEVEQATHLGIIRTTTMKHNIQTNVDENITKARRSAYSLFGCGFHAHINQLLLDSSFTVRCLLASFFSVFFSPWCQTLLKNVRAFIWICASIGRIPVII
jgi:hypothetical protein